MGIVLLSGGRRRAAEKVFRRCIDANPGSAEARSNLGRFLYSVGRKDEALTAWREAVARDPLHFDSHRILGVRMMERKEFASAVTHFKAALRVRPKDPQCLMRLSEAYAGTGDKRRAVESIDRALRAAREEGDQALESECQQRRLQYLK